MFPKISLTSELKKLPGLGTVYTRRLESLGIITVEDLLYYFPFRFEDLSDHRAISDLAVGDKITVQARLWQITKINTRTGKTMIKALVNDGNASLDVIWFNQTYLLTVLKPNQLINLSGKVGLFGKKLCLTNPTFEIIKDNVATPIHTDRLVPIYSESAGVSTKWFRTKIHQILSSGIDAPEYLPAEISQQEELIPLEEALQQIHFPENLDQFLKAKDRLAFEELLLLHLRNLKLARKEAKDQKSPILEASQDELEKFEKNLPFTLTETQKQAALEIKSDLQKEKPMHRLLQGEVGSGKTVVSAFAFKICVSSGFQGALLAPTEILARQHFATLQKFLGSEIDIKLVTGASKPDLTSVQIVVGTHALLNKVESLDKLGLVVVDEQQRFGVLQRSVLQHKHPSPHLLTMTATPIPRTLALTLYGEMAISVLNALPTGRKKIKTYLVPPVKRDGAYEFIRKEVKAGGQAYIICPLIEESESLLTVKSAKKEFEFLQKEVFPSLNLALLHGKNKPSEKTEILQAFRDNKADILVATPVVEVGIDVPNASIMLIEGADRFGLSSLHQMRGRVGRGERQSYCLLFSSSRRPEVNERLKLLEKYDNGFDLAQMDLERRGPGEMYGLLQHGQVGLKLANMTDMKELVESRIWAEKMSEKPLPEILEKKVEASISEVQKAIAD